MADLLAARSVSSLYVVLLDHCISSFQLYEASRSFSFRSDWPLYMRLERSCKSAADLVNTLGDSELADILFTLGE